GHVHDDGVAVSVEVTVCPGSESAEVGMPEGVGAAVTTAGAAVAVACFTTEVISLGSGTLSCALTAMVDAPAATMAANTAPAIPIRFRLTRLISFTSRPWTEVRL